MQGYPVLAFKTQLVSGNPNKILVAYICMVKALLTIPRCWPGRPAHLSKSIDAIEIAWNKPCDRGLVLALRFVGVWSLRLNVGRICFW